MKSSQRFSRREMLTHAITAGGASLLSGCLASGQVDEPELVWGRRGMANGRFLKPRCFAIDPDDRLFICDTTGRIQVFDADGNYQYHWTTPETANGRPTGLAIRDADEHFDQPMLMVADTHYYQMLAYSLDGTLMPEYCIGGKAGVGPGEFAFVTEADRDAEGNFYIGDYNAADRVQKFSRDREFICQWGQTGDLPGQFLRPQSFVVAGDVIYVADSGNHRIQAFDLTTDTPKLINVWGKQGDGLGELYYPYDITLIPGEDPILLVCEYGGQRIQKFDLSGKALGTWGSPGFAAGKLYQPWGVVVDSQRRTHVLDSNNHRVQRISAGFLSA